MDWGSLLGRIIIFNVRNLSMTHWEVAFQRQNIVSRKVSFWTFPSSLQDKHLPQMEIINSIWFIFDSVTISVKSSPNLPLQMYYYSKMYVKDH